MTKKWKDRDLIRRALHEAYVNVDGLADAHGYDPNDPVVQECTDFLAAIERYSQRKYGVSVAAEYLTKMKRRAGTPGRMNAAGVWEPLS